MGPLWVWGRAPESVDGRQLSAASFFDSLALVLLQSCLHTEDVPAESRCPQSCPQLELDNRSESLIVQVAGNPAVSVTAPPAQGSTAQDTEALGVSASDAAQQYLHCSWVFITPTMIDIPTSVDCVKL